MRAIFSKIGRNYLLPRDLSHRLKCSERTIREHCKRGRLSARRTPGGQWRIEWPPPARTLTFLHRRALRAESAFIKDSHAKRESEADWTPESMLSHLFEDRNSLNETEWNESTLPRLLDAKRQIHKEILQEDRKQRTTLGHTVARLCDAILACA